MPSPHRPMPHPLTRVGHSQPCITGNTNDDIICILSDGQHLAGVAPSTRQSGKMRSVGFRWACNKQLRDAICDFADASRRANPWAAQLYGRSRARGHDHPHAVRVVARAWVYII
jgi:transposase